MSQQGRNEAGKFSAKSDEIRQVRSIRLTNTTWDALGKLAEERSITRADLLEDWMKSEYFNLEDKIKALELEMQNLKNSSIHLSEITLENLDGIAIQRGITREEVISNLLVEKVQIEPEVKPNQLYIAGLEELQSSDAQDKKFVFESGLTQSELAKRLGCDSSNLGKQRAKGNEKLAVYSASKDKDNITWRYSEADKLYFPV